MDERRLKKVVIFDGLHAKVTIAPNKKVEFEQKYHSDIELSASEMEDLIREWNLVSDPSGWNHIEQVIKDQHGD